MSKLFFLKKADLNSLLGKIAENYEVYVPVKKGEQRFYQKYTGSAEDVVIGEVRAFEPLKAFFTRAREIVAEGFKTDLPHSEDRPIAVIGAKACDLKGFKIQDYVFAGSDFRDPLYARNREQNLIVSADCTCAIETCFCTAVGIQPYPEEHFDLNLSELTDGFLLETGSPKGESLARECSSFLGEAREDRTAPRDAQRAEVQEAVKANHEKYGIPDENRFKGMIEKNFESELWKDEAKTCVECGACNTICPTCHCFLLYDQKDEKRMARFRIWDSCMVKDFARVAGGGNPRERLWARLRNRFEKKFDFFPKVAGVYACTGCGRCISACPAKIDIRKVLKRLVGGA